MAEDPKSYASYTEEDYLENQDFRKWVLEPLSYEGPDWEALFRKNPSQAELGRRARAMLLEMQTYFFPEGSSLQGPSEAFLAKLEEPVPAKESRNAVDRRIFFRRMAIAASLCFLIGIAIWQVGDAPAPDMQTLRTHYGEWKTHTLPDGSEVKLNANSQIRFANKWKEGADRFVWLKGEAFFKVSKDSHGTKFTVVTEDMEIKVLGTAFNVHSRGQETGVFLMEGKIELDLGKEEKEMLPGEYIAYSAPREEIIQYKNVEADSYVSWKEGSLIMQDAKVEEILSKIEEIYGLEIQVLDKELLHVEKTIAIPMDKIEVSIPILSRTFGTEVKLREEILIVGP